MADTRILTNTEVNEGVKKLYEPLLKNGRTFVITDSTLPLTDFSNGNLFVEIDNSGFYHLYCNTSGAKKHFAPYGLIDAHSIDSNLLAELSIEGKHIRENAINTEHLTNNCVTAIKMQDRSVTSNKIAQESILDEHFELNSLNGNRLKDNSLSGAKLKDNSIAGSKILSQSITDKQMAPNSINSSHLKSACVTSEHLTNQCILARHLSSQCITTDALKDECVTAEKIAPASIYEKHLTPQCINGDKIQPQSITGSHLAPGSIALTHCDASLQKLFNQSLQFVDNTCTVKGYLDVQETIRCKNLIASAYIKGTQLDIASDTILHGTLKTESGSQLGGNVLVNGNVTATGKVYNAGYNNDLAEAYIPGCDLKVGQIVALHEDGKIYPAENTDKCIVGVISDTYATCYGASPEELKNGSKIAVGLIGRVKVKIADTVMQGDEIAVFSKGCGINYVNAFHAPIIGIALESSKGDFVNCLISPAYRRS